MVYCPVFSLKFVNTLQLVLPALKLEFKVSQQSISNQSATNQQLISNQWATAKQPINNQKAIIKLPISNQ